MTNDLVKAPFGGVIDLADDRALLAQMQETADVGARMEGVMFGSFSGKKGVYSLGTDKREPGEDEPFLVAIPLFRVGYTCWKGGKPVAQRMAGLREPKVMEPTDDEFGPFDDRKGEGWHLTRSFGCRSLETGEELSFSNNSKSGVAGIAALQKSIMERIAEGKPAWPIIYFGREEFESQGFKNYKPTFEVTKWLDRSDIVQWTGDFDPMSWLDDAPAPTPVVEPRRRKAVL